MLLCLRYQKFESKSTKLIPHVHLPTPSAAKQEPMPCCLVVRLRLFSTPRSPPTDRLLVMCLPLTVTAAEALHRARRRQRQRPHSVGRDLPGCSNFLGTIDGHLILCFFSFNFMVRGHVLDQSYASGELSYMVYSFEISRQLLMFI